MACFLLLSLVICHSTFASPASSLEGTVMLWSSDESVAGVTVTVTGEDRPVARETTTDSSGEFRFPLLPPGRYSVMAAASGYSTVTVVGVFLVPGEERRVTLEVTRTDEEESVTETVTAALQAQGIDGGWIVPALDAATLPLLRGTIDEVAALFPMPAGTTGSREEGGALPIEAAGPANTVTTAAGAPFAHARANRLMVVPRWGAGRMQGGVRLVRGESLESENVEEGSSSRDDWFRGVLTLGGNGADGNLSGFLSIDHDERDGGRRVATAERTAITATAALATAAQHSIFLVADGAVLDARAADEIVAGLDRSRWSVRASHAWQLSARAATTIDLSVEEREDDAGGAGDLLPSLRARERAVRLDESVAWLPGSRLRHELRGGVTARVGIDESLTIGDALSGTKALRRDRDEAGVWLEDELMLDRLLLRGGLRVEHFRGERGDTTDVAPRVAFAWHTTGDEPLVLRGSWGRFHENPSLLDMLFRSDPTGLTATDFDPALLRPVRTDRAVVGASRDLSGFAAWSLDVVSSKSADIPYLQSGALRLGDAELLEVTLGARLDLFGKADALLAWTWSDSEGNVPGWEIAEHRGSLALRATLPAGWTAAAIVRHDSGLPCAQDCTGSAGESSSTNVDLSLSKTLDVSTGIARIAVDTFNVTDADVSWSVHGADGAARLPVANGTMPGRSLALNVSYRFGD
jgi:hypothetical protein